MLFVFIDSGRIQDNKTWVHCDGYNNNYYTTEIEADSEEEALSIFNYKQRINEDKIYRVQLLKPFYK